MLALLINVGYGRYRNEFRARHDGRVTVSWTTSLADCERSQVMAQRLGRVMGLGWEDGDAVRGRAEDGEDGGRGSGGGGVGEEGKEGGEVDDGEEGLVMLFCRLKGASYVNMGALILRVWGMRVWGWEVRFCDWQLGLGVVILMHTDGGMTGRFSA